MNKLLILMLALLPLYVLAQQEAEFETAEQRARYQEMIHELRCLVCQNQTIADSHADLAKDLRDEVAEQIRAGRSDAEIIEYLTARYGDFVLYRPPVNQNTYLLWAGPFVLLAIGLVVLGVTLRRRANLPESDDESEDDEARNPNRPEKDS